MKVDAFFISWNMDFLEKDLEEIIFNADRELLSDKGLSINGVVKRQLKIGNYGISDLVSFERQYDENFFDERKLVPILNITVYELKKDKIGISAFLQAVGYVKGLKRYFDKREVSYSINYSIVLIGRLIDDNSTFTFLEDILPMNNDTSTFLQCYTYSYDVDGIDFKYKYGYKLTNEGF